MTSRGPGRSGRRALSALAVALLVLPLLEILVIIAVGRAIGGWPTFLLLVVESAFGAWLVRREGGRAWRALREALRTGRMPAGELADAALVLVGGTLLLTPGFVTDVAGFFFVLPMTRPVARRLLTGLVERRLLGATPWGRGWSSDRVVPGQVVGDDTPRASGQPAAPGTGVPEGVIEGEVVDEQPPDPEHGTGRTS